MGRKNVNSGKPASLYQWEEVHTSLPAETSFLISMRERHEEHFLWREIREWEFFFLLAREYSGEYVSLRR